MWADAELPLSLKMRLFKVGIISILAYGVESWDLTEGSKRAIRDWNSRCLHTSAQDHGEEPQGRVCGPDLQPGRPPSPKVLQRRQNWIHSLLGCPEASLPRRVFLTPLPLTQSCLVWVQPKKEIPIIDFISLEKKSRLSSSQSC